MINLLPPDVQRNISYARRNAHIAKWMSGLLIGIAGIGLVTGAGFMYMDRLGKNYAVQAAEAQAALNRQNPALTQKQVEDITSSLKLVVQVLSKEVLFSKLLRQIGASLPPGSVLSGLSINKVQGGIDLIASATDYKTASQVQVNLQDPNNKIFDKADIVSIRCENNSIGNTSNLYPCVVVIRAQFAKNNPFLFINSGTASVVKS
ncbi:MAG: hypothetical protein NVS1B7_0100 [Candidatus Saccharimonadales bacterium]